MPFYPSKTETGNVPPDPKKNRRMIIRRMIFCVSVVMITYGSIKIAGYIGEYDASRQTTRELREIAATAADEKHDEVMAIHTAPSETVHSNHQPNESVSTTLSPQNNIEPTEMLLPNEYPDGLKVSERIRKLREKSSDIIGWITMDDLDEPVVMRDNRFFLNHDATGKRNSNGAIFMDEETNLLTRPYTILLFGHNMKTGAMFGNLRKYEKLSYCSKHQIFNLETLYDQAQYVIFAVSNINITPGNSRYVSLDDIQSLNRVTRRKAMEALMNQSVNGVTLDVNEEDQLLLLLTCVGDDDERLVVAARRMRENEKPDSLILKK